MEERYLRLSLVRQTVRDVLKACVDDGVGRPDVLADINVRLQGALERGGARDVGA